MKRIITCLLILFNVYSMSARVVIKNSEDIKKIIADGNETIVIKKPISLNGGKMVLPKNSRLKFHPGGQISNGVLIGNNTKVIGLNVESIEFRGTFANPTLTIDYEHFGKRIDLLGVFASFQNAKVFLNSDIVDAFSSKEQIKSLNIEGNGHKIKMSKISFDKNPKVNINNVIFDCSNAIDDFIYPVGDYSSEFILTNSKFINVGEVNLINIRRFNGVQFENNEIIGLMNENSRRKRPISVCILLYECRGIISFRNNVILNCFGVAIDGIGFSKASHTKITISNNKIDKTTNGGIVFSGGEVYNVVLENNNISNTHFLGNSFPGENNGAHNSAINFHGFNNIRVSDNIITDCPNSSCFDFDGSSGKDNIIKGNKLIVKNNKCNNVGGIALFGVNDSELSGNVLSSSIYHDGRTLNFIGVNGSNKVRIANNNISVVKPKRGGRAYPIYVTNTGKMQSGDIVIENNIVSNDGDTFYLSNALFNGKSYIRGNRTSLKSDKNRQLRVVNNASKNSLQISE